MKAQFDNQAVFTIEIESGAQQKTCELRYPTDAEWIAAAAKRSTRIDNLGRGKTQDRSVNWTSSRAELFAVIRQDAGGSDFDEVEAAEAVLRVEESEIIESAYEGGQVTVRLKVPIMVDGTAAIPALGGGLITRHVLRAPTLKQRHEWIKAVYTSVGDAKGVVQKTALDPSGRLYRELVVESRGYENTKSVPLPHMAEVVHEVLKVTNPQREGQQGEAKPPMVLEA